MALFVLRFDMRNPAVAGVSSHDRFQAALDMAEWADALGFLSILISEHHGSPDGFLPSAPTMAAAIAARTKRSRINIAAVVAAFHDPLRLAEDLAIVDIISGGRLDVTVVKGYVLSEFEMFGVPRDQRARRTEEMVTTLQKAWTGEPFEFRGRPARITPRPHRPGGPRIAMGGSSEVAARRAARMGVSFTPSSEGAWDFYRRECLALGQADPGPHVLAGTSVIHLATDPEKGWKDLAPYALHDANAYGRWMADNGIGAIGGYTLATDADELRARGQFRVLTPEQLVDELSELGAYHTCVLHPMVGGLSPEVAWNSLHLLEQYVLPKVERPVLG
jgi:alkanesulfonate monooxygenase SsuD/methylene tetrahydromethanopterin reductase-like flavin-dependent oxidoreductase (luciferase family)